jgi:hypothetical protein
LYKTKEEIDLKLVVLLLVAGIAMGGCSSPEAARTRGGGPGGDTGNRDKILDMHEGSRPFWETPKLIPGNHPPLEPASQADQLSR